MEAGPVLKPLFRTSASIALLAFAPPVRSAPVEISPDAWVLTGENVSLADHLGRPSLHVVDGRAYVKGLDFRDGTIEADFDNDKEGRFFGFVFRVETKDDCETVFFRPGASGTDGAIQYTPTLRGVNTWQLYSGPEANGTADIPQGRWVHVKIEVAGLTAKVYVDGRPEPSLVVSDLRRGYVKGSVGFWGRQKGAWFSNVTVTTDTTVHRLGPPRAFLPGALTEWEISDAFDAGSTNPEAYPDAGGLKWEKVQAEAPGMVVLNRYRTGPIVFPGFEAIRPRTPDLALPRVPGAKVLFARTTVVSDRQQLRRMSFGYSDDIVIFLNGRPVFSGRGGYAVREPSAQGLVNVNNDAVFLDLKKGPNEILLAVSEYFGGWGYICRLDPPEPSAR